MKAHFAYVAIVGVLLLCGISIAWAVDGKCSSGASCTDPHDVDDCAYCCPGINTCCTCCNENFTKGSEGYNYCIAYCADVHAPGKCPSID